jgi:hypothetical protein
MVSFPGPDTGPSAGKRQFSPARQAAHGQEVTAQLFPQLFYWGL